jgi:alkanesulfonate monooxygenase SsuD/methylene tetrahydromethanopterin reductase-like flavin-dependent oxidoreductase (luciferase family)
MRFDATPYYHVGLAQYPWDRVIDEIVETARLQEQVGFTTMWFAEHHFAWDGWYRAFPNPILAGTTVGAKTERLRIGQCGVNLPDRHPLHVAEDIAFLDQATKGRVDFGVMRGLNGRWNHQFNSDADRRDPARNYELFTECLEIVTKALSQDAFSHEGQFYRLPAPGWKDRSVVYPLEPPYYTADGEMVRLGITPRPFQKPHPPIWQMADTTESHAFAGARGLGATIDSVPGSDYRPRLSPWPPAGSNWQSAVNSERADDLTAVELQSDEPAGMATRWGSILGLPVCREGDTEWQIRLFDGDIRFVRATDGREAAIGGFDVKARDPGTILAAAEARGLRSGERQLVVCGTRINLR